MGRPGVDCKKEPKRSFTGNSRGGRNVNRHIKIERIGTKPKKKKVTD